MKIEIEGYIRKCAKDLVPVCKHVFKCVKLGILQRGSVEVDFL